MLSTLPHSPPSSPQSGPSEVIFLAELVVLMLVGRLLGEAMQRIGQPSVMGQLLAGILLGPSVLGWLWPDLQHWIFPAAKEQKSMIDAVSQFGILLLLLLTGMETDLKLVSKGRPRRHQHFADRGGGAVRLRRHARSGSCRNRCCRTRASAC